MDTPPPPAAPAVPLPPWGRIFTLDTASPPLANAGLRRGRKHTHGTAGACGLPGATGLAGCEPCGARRRRVGLLPEGRAPLAGEIHHQRELAATLIRHEHRALPQLAMRLAAAGVAAKGIFAR